MNNITDLGVIFDSKLLFNDHLVHIINKSFRNLGFIFRNMKQFKSMKTLILLYNSFVRSKLDYCSIIWCPYYVKYIQAIENVQKKFIKYSNYILFGFYGSNDDYLNNLEQYNMTTLYNRRKYFSIIYLYKLMNNLTVDILLLSKVNISVPCLKTRSYKTFHYDTPRTNYQGRSPLTIMYTNYNSMQDACDIFGDSLNCFSNKLKNKLGRVHQHVDIT